MDHAQRSNAVGSLPSYLPDGDPGRQGGNTYTGGNSTEPTIQDYENVFGPSARDIKTDLQRFKRHGRWHLPDVLKGPNPWLTDRVDGLITDATNSPFTTKLLPYLYKEDVDGKMKWNVWSFDEGMASRVPYESAARTLTQSKRSFSGYMVRQGMALVLEHNFMMSPAGRENFKNQLNQLIGSIQYTNDLDVHMALILAPSHAKTMRERYYSLDKSPSQICREFVDLFGMMQKNVNALDILIEEGKAILRTWGGPMPDFLLCNSKLTFQMTMNPEKTNYITQGADGIKRLKQGPDLTSYRGLSIIHSRSFSMETGQAPRDVLRRRVRTAEYYRILPSKKNINREFEFYNEERDTWFTLSFQELLKYAMHTNHGGDGGGRDNAAMINRIYKKLLKGSGLADSASGSSPALLGSDLGMTLAAPRRLAAVLTARENTFFQSCETTIDRSATHPLYSLYSSSVLRFGTGSPYSWAIRLRGFDMGVTHLKPQHSLLWNKWNTLASSRVREIGLDDSRAVNGLTIQPRLTPSMMRDLFESMQFISLNDPFDVGRKATPGTSAWFSAYAFYLEIYKRSGIPMDWINDNDATAFQAITAAHNRNFPGTRQLVDNLAIRAPLPAMDKTDMTVQFLGASGAVGSVNHVLHILPMMRQNNFPADNLLEPLLLQKYTNTGSILGGRVLLTYEILAPLLRIYRVNGSAVSGIDFIRRGLYTMKPAFVTEMRLLCRSSRPANNMVELTVGEGPKIVELVKGLLDGQIPWDSEIPDSVYLARSGINTWPMFLTTLSHLGHPKNENAIELDFFKSSRHLLEMSQGHLNFRFLKNVKRARDAGELNGYDTRNAILTTTNFPGMPACPVFSASGVAEFESFWNILHDRIFADPVEKCVYLQHMAPAVPATGRYMACLPNSRMELEYLDNLSARLAGRAADDVTSTIADDGLDHVVIDMDRFFLPEPDNPGPPAKPGPSMDNDRYEDVEIVVVRPNIEHNMLGVIMGLGGSELGHTLWGQTELSVYDDSMHGIWGMSYKYHERAIVFNEKNLIRLWDIAYDGYNGGKDDTYVDWTSEDAPNGVRNFQEMTMDVSKNYRGPSMMVMAFVHDREAKSDEGRPLYDKHFLRNWPSPIVFHDSYNPNNAPAPEKETLPLDYDNLQVVDVEQFRVFNNPLYYGPYRQYREMMPAFHEMHMMRKSAGQSSADSETHTDSLAFQGSMRVKEAGRGAVEEIQGSGHHGPDYTGVASVRAGKGQKVAVQAPIPHRLI